MKHGSHRRVPLQTDPLSRSAAAGKPADSASCCPPDICVSAHAIHFGDNGSLLLPLDTRQFAFSGAMQLPGPDGTSLHRKSELHITLMDSEAVRQVCGRMSSDGLLEQARALDWAIGRPGDGAVLGTDDREPKGSLVEWVDLPAMHALRAQVAASTGIGLPVTRPHITHYASDDKGIGVTDMDMLQCLLRGELRLPGVAPATPSTSAQQVAKDYNDGCSLLPPDVRVEVGTHASAVDRWLRRHDARSAFLFSVKAPFSGCDSRLGDRCRWAMLDAFGASEGIRLMPIRAKEEPDDAFAISGCLLDVPVAIADRLLRDYEQLAAVRVGHGASAELYCHPQLRRLGRRP